MVEVEVTSHQEVEVADHSNGWLMACTDTMWYSKFGNAWIFLSCYYCYPGTSIKSSGYKYVPGTNVSAILIQGVNNPCTYLHTDQIGSVSGVSSVNNFSAQINAQIKTVSQFNSNLKHKSHRSRSIRFHENHGMVRWEIGIISAKPTVVLLSFFVCFLNRLI